MKERKNYIVGTTGHIDHGKTQLSIALTGKNTDRLKEEQERNISIELGFAPFELPNKSQVSLIDVPGHEKFVHHMVAGVSGIDLVLLVIAADEGVMPQTVEHLQIINLLNIKHGIIVITKKDLVDDEMLELVQEDTEELLKNSTLKGAPFICVSNKTKEGINDLKVLIQDELSKIPERSHTGFFRMPIDRVFTLKGIGTVVTGTVLSGKMRVGEDIEIIPPSKKAHVRSIQVHSSSEEEVYAGQRVAINLAGIDLQEVTRGKSLVTPNYWTPSYRIDVKINIIDNLDFSLRQNCKVKVHTGTSEVMGELILYDRKEALSGDTIYCQIKLEEQIISSMKDNIILRRPSPATTIGGGYIIETNAVKHKYNVETVDRIKNKSKGSIEDLIIHELNTNEEVLLTSKDLSNILIVPVSIIDDSLNKLLLDNSIISILDKTTNYYILKQIYQRIVDKINDSLIKHHEKYPLKFGKLKAEFMKKIFPNTKTRIVQTFFTFIEDKKIIKINEEYISQYDFYPIVNDKLQEKVNLIEKKLLEQKFTPDTWDNLTVEFNINDTDILDLFNYLIDQKKIIKLTEKYVIHYTNFELLIKIISEFLNKEKTISLQQAKDLLQVSRKYLVPLMELLDKEKITIFRPEHSFRELR